MHIKQSIIDRFFSYTKISINKCIEWTKSVTYRGYGRFWHEGKSISSHRFSWIIKNGPIPTGLIICHSCDNTKCVNPDHLWLGTHKDNAKDRDYKKRSNRRSKYLTQEQEEQIGFKYFKTEATQKELAQEYNVTRELINRTLIVNKFKDKYGVKSLHRSKKISSAMRQVIIKMSLQGESKKDLARLFNVTPKAINYHLKIAESREKNRVLQNKRRRLQPAP